MSRETAEWLNTQTLIGFTDARGNAWHYRESLQGDEPNHYAGAIPMADVERRLFDWEAVKVPVYVLNDGTYTEVPGTAAIQASDDLSVLGMHSDGYEVHPFRDWLLGPVSGLLGDDLSISSAGLLRNRSVAWVQIEKPDTIKTAEGVTFRPHILMSTSLDGSLASQINDAVTNTVCDNTMAVARREGVRFRIKHTKNSGKGLADAKAALVRLLALEDDFAAEVKLLCETEVNPKQWSRFLEMHIPLSTDSEPSKRAVTVAENKRESLTQMWNTDMRVAPWHGTAWGVVQAVNTYQHHLATVRANTTRTDRNMWRAVKGEWEDVDAQTLATLELALS